MRIIRDVQNRWSCPRARSWTRSRSGHPPSWARRVATDRKAAGRIITVSDGKNNKIHKRGKKISTTKKKKENKRRERKKKNERRKKRVQRREENRRVSWRRKEGRRGGEEKRVVSGTGPSWNSAVTPEY